MSLYLHHRPEAPAVTFDWCGTAFAVWLTTVALGGCASTGTIDPDGNSVRHYLGYVKEVVPLAAARGAVYSSDVSVVGLRVSNGVGVGYSRDRQVVVPLDCRLAIMVANQAQLDDALARLPALLGNSGICAVINPFIESGEKP